MRQRLDDAGAEPDLARAKASVACRCRCRDRQFPVRAGHVVRNGDLFGFFVGKGVFTAFKTSSVTIKPRLSAWRDVALPLAATINPMGRVSPIIEVVRVSHSLVR